MVSPGFSANARQPLRFLRVGVVNTLIGLSIIYAGMALLGLSNEMANAIGYSCALIVSFILNKKWTFEHYGHLLASGLRFGVVIAVAYCANLVTLTGLIEGPGFNAYLAQAVSIIPYTLISYLGCKYFAFRSG